MRKIYIIDDDANCAFSLKAKLSVNGFNVEASPSAVSNEGVILEIRKYWPDLIILEPVLQILDGLKLLYDLRKGENGLKVPVFIYTNAMDENLKSKANLYGADFIFNKSEIIIDDFVTKINKIMVNRGKVSV